MRTITAKELSNHIDCIGSSIYTYPMGEWEGGQCTVIDVEPDPNAPEIPIQVRRDLDGSEIGVFADEPVFILSDLN